MSLVSLTWKQLFSKKCKNKEDNEKALLFGKKKKKKVYLFERTLCIVKDNISYRIWIDVQQVWVYISIKILLKFKSSSVSVWMISLTSIMN